jgi:DNA invertase Pin-like site-specific DNA recombinase
MRTAYSYARYSSEAQGDGDSLRRQTEGAIAWCERNRVRLDTSKTFLDRGKSAYRGKNREEGTALSSFLSEVERGSIPRSSVLVIESLDRLTRQHPLDAIPFFCSIMNSGLTVVTLSPSVVVYERESGLTLLILAVLELVRSHNESKVKGERVSAAWEQKRELARKEKAILTRKTPAWIEIQGKKLVLHPERAAIVRKMFTWASQGYGVRRIIKKLTEQNVPTWGGGRSWSQHYVRKILTGRAVLGELHVTSGGKPEPPIVGYFPPVIDESIWEAVREAMKRRKHKRGPIGKKVASLFGGLLFDAMTHEPIYIAWQLVGKLEAQKRVRFLVPAGSLEGAGRRVSFPHSIFEEGILKLLGEVNPAEVLGEEPPSESRTIALTLANKESRLEEIEAALTGDSDDVATLARAAKKLESDCTDLREKLARARLLESNPRSAAWAEAQTLFDVAKDEAQRLRLRELLRNTIEQILMLIVKRGSQRFAVIQVLFQRGDARNYLFWYRANYGQGSDWLACSLPSELGADDLDLRRKKDAAKVAKELGRIDVDALVQAMRAR